MMERLREATAAEHRDLESCLELSQRLRSPADYAQLLADFHGFHRPYERKLAQVWPQDAAPFALSPRLRLSALEADLIALGWKPDRISALPEAQELPALANMASIMGGLYVTEGSTLGGRFIVQELESAKMPRNAMNYFRSYGEGVAAMWKEFGTKMEHFAKETERSDDIVDGAKQTFGAMKRWLCRGGNGDGF